MNPSTLEQISLFKKGLKQVGKLCGKGNLPLLWMENFMLQHHQSSISVSSLFSLIISEGKIYVHICMKGYIVVRARNGEFVGGKGLKRYDKKDL